MAYLRKFLTLLHRKVNLPATRGKPSMADFMLKISSLNKDEDLSLKFER